MELNINNLESPRQPRPKIRIWYWSLVEIDTETGQFKLLQQSQKPVGAEKKAKKNKKVIEEFSGGEDEVEEIL